MKITRKTVVALAAIAAVAVLATSAVYWTGGGKRNVAGPPTPASGTGTETSKLAAFVLHAEPKEIAAGSFATIDGEPKTLADWRGKAILVNIWATWCAPCRHEMPSLDRLEARLGGVDFEVVAISLDRNGAAKAKAFFAEIGVRHLALYVDESARLGSALGAIGMPTSILINAEGLEVGRLAGPAAWDSPEAVALIARTVGVGS